ncbi:MAG TPA: hypothetical protein VF173_09240 [Thermoanaerobaculia bacterium]|nr:hypothetical protein [Thermoanaerobaculia bacterium]
MDTDFKAGRIMRATVSAQWLTDQSSGNLDALKSHDDVIFKEFDTALVIDSLREHHKKFTLVLQWLIEEPDLSSRIWLLALILDVFAEPTEPNKENPVFALRQKVGDLFTTVKSQEPANIAPIIIAMNLARLDENFRSDCVSFILRNPQRALEAVHHFYGTADFREIYLRLRDRWYEHGYVLQDLVDLDALNPLLLHLVPPVYAGASLGFVPRFVRALSSGTKVTELRKLSEDLAKQVRLVQWEVFTRVPPSNDFLGARDTTDGGTGLPSVDFLQRLSRFSRFAHRRYFVGVIGRPHVRDADAKLEDESKYPDHDSFSNLLSRAALVHPTLHSDLIENLRAKKGAILPQCILIEDGELAFFSLLWTLRHEGIDALSEAGWLENSETGPGKLRARFTFPGTSPEWCEIAFLEYFDWLGLILLDGNKLIFTRRWRAFVIWMQSVRTVANYMKTLHDDESLPIEPLAEQVEKAKVCTGIWLKNEVSRAFAYELPESGGVDFLRSLLSHLQGAIDPTPSSEWDRNLLRLCRAPFLPLEMVLRAYQPHEMSLLIALLGFHPERIGKELILAPISLGFATLIGAVPKMIDDEKPAPNWVGPYWSLLSALATEISARYLARELTRGTALQLFRSEIEKRNVNPPVSVHDQFAQATVDRWQEYSAVKDVVSFLSLASKTSEIFIEGQNKNLPPRIAESFKILALRDERPVTSLTLACLANAVHMRLGGDGDKCNLGSLAQIMAFAVWNQRAALPEFQMLDLFWEMCERLFTPPIGSKAKSNLESVQMTGTQLEFVVNVDFSLLSFSLTERTRKILSGDALRGASNTSSYSVLRFWIASSTRDNHRGEKRLRGCHAAASSFRLEPGANSSQTKLVWEKQA